MSAKARPAHLSMRDALYEEPGPRTRRRVLVGTVVASLVLAALVALVMHRFWAEGLLTAPYWYFFAEPTTWTFLFSGFFGTMSVALTSAALALVLALALMLGRISDTRPLSVLCRILTDFFRSMPSLLMIYFFFLVAPQYGVRLPPFWMLTIPVALGTSGVLAEVLRAGVNAVPRGQSEAALSIGMRMMRVRMTIVLPQALRFVVPSLISQLVVVIKDTTLAYVVSYPDLFQNARVLLTNYNALVSTYIVAAVIYILLCYAINRLAVIASKRMHAPRVDRMTQDPT